MREWLFLPEQASSIARAIDAAYLYLWAITLLFTGIVYVVVIVAAVTYRRRSPDEIPRPAAGSIPLEIVSNSFIFVVFLTGFVVGTATYFEQYRIPPDATFDIHVVGKQWMWQFQHLTGRREINELHVPSHTKIRLTMATEDVIHSLYLPAFRMKQDVVPGRYTQMWFEAIEEGVFPIYCAEYCGLEHSGMIGHVIVQNPSEYQNWAAGAGSDLTPVQAGAALFEQRGCAGCHVAGPQAPRCPPLTNLIGSTVPLVGGRQVVADVNYIRESILDPQAKIVEGYPNIMPTFQGQLTEMQLIQLLAYIRSLSQVPGTPGSAGAAPPPQNQPATPRQP
jgi:cytochrome c oxidase subunit 2